MKTKKFSLFGKKIISSASAFVKKYFKMVFSPVAKLANICFDFAAAIVIKYIKKVFLTVAGISIVCFLITIVQNLFGFTVTLWIKQTAMIATVTWCLIAVLSIHWHRYQSHRRRRHPSDAGIIALMFLYGLGMLILGKLLYPYFAGQPHDKTLILFGASVLTMSIIMICAVTIVALLRSLAQKIIEEK